MRLIDADALKNLPFERMFHTDCGDMTIPIEEINNAPTVNPCDNCDLYFIAKTKEECRKAEQNEDIK